MNALAWRAIKRGVAVSLMMGLLLCLAACEKSAQDNMREGRGALAAGNYDVAEQRFNEALSAEPGLFEARRLLVDVQAGRGDFKGAESALEKLWEEEGLGAKGDLGAEQRRNRGLINDQFDRLYRRWVEAVDTTTDPETFEEVARKGLERDNRNARLNALLSEFYQERAERFVERGEKMRAAEELEKIEDLRIFADMRRQLRERAQNLRKEAFAQEARARFEEKVQPDLVESDSYDATKERIKLPVEQAVDRSLNPANDEDRQRAQALALRALVPTLAQMAVAVSGQPMDEQALGAMKTPKFTFDGENFRRGRYAVVVEFSLESLIEMAFEYAEQVRTKEDEQKASDSSENEEDSADEEQPEEAQE